MPPHLRNFFRRQIAANFAAFLAVANQAAEQRLMSMLNIQPDMLNDERECIERAYESQADNIAYVIPEELARAQAAK